MNKSRDRRHDYLADKKTKVTDSQLNESLIICAKKKKNTASSIYKGKRCGHFV